MSPKYRRLAGLPGATGQAVVDADTPCGGCGYELRGLRRGSACPECGSAIPVDTLGPGRVDPFLRLDVRQRERVRTGATLAAIGLLMVAVEPIASLALGVVVAISGGGAGLAMSIGVRSVGLIACGLWVTAGLIAAPAALWTGPSVLGRSGRLPVLGLLVGWAVGQLAAIVLVYEASNRFGGPAPGWVGTLLGLSLVLRVLGGAAAGVVLLVIARAAENAELEPGTDRLMTGVFVLPLLGFVVWLIPTTMPWFLVLAYLLVFLLPWAWFAWRTGLGMLAVARHVKWANRIGRQAAGRDDRIAATRDEVDAQWKQTVRAVPGGGPVAPTRRRAGVTCAACGYDLQNTPVAARCPECGGEDTA